MTTVYVKAGLDKSKPFTSYMTGAPDYKRIDAYDQARDEVRSLIQDGVSFDSITVYDVDSDGTTYVYSRKEMASFIGA